MTIQFTSIVPILRIFDVAKADELYQGFLDFKVDALTTTRRSTARCRAAISSCTWASITETGVLARDCA
jgi:hypothetical protein